MASSGPAGRMPTFRPRSAARGRALEIVWAAACAEISSPRIDPPRGTERTLAENKMAAENFKKPARPPKLDILVRLCIEQWLFRLNIAQLNLSRSGPAPR